MPLGLPDGGRSCQAAKRGTMADFFRPGWFFRLMLDNFLLVPADLTTCRYLLPAEKTVAGLGRASIVSGGLVSIFS